MTTKLDRLMDDLQPILEEYGLDYVFVRDTLRQWFEEQKPTLNEEMEKKR